MVDAHVELVDPIPMTGWKIIRLGTVESCGRKPRFIYVGKDAFDSILWDDKLCIIRYRVKY